MDASHVSDKEKRRMRIQRRINDIQFGPVKSLPMTLFMLWMVGNEISLFSIMFVGMAITNPISALMNTGGTFEQFAEVVREDPTLSSSITQGKLIYAACCLAAFVVGLMKLAWMGLMPVSASDWMDHRPPTLSESSRGSLW